MSGISITAFSTGQSNQVVVIGPYGRVDLSVVTSFDASPDIKEVTCEPMSGTTITVEIPRRWKGSFEVDRADSTLDDLQAVMELNFLNGVAVPASSIYQYIDELDGSTSTYQYSLCTLKLANAGAWKGDSAVKQKLEFTARTRRRV